MAGADIVNLAEDGKGLQLREIFFGGESRCDQIAYHKERAMESRPVAAVK